MSHALFICSFIVYLVATLCSCGSVLLAISKSRPTGLAMMATKVGMLNIDNGIFTSATGHHSAGVRHLSQPGTLARVGRF